MAQNVCPQCGAPVEADSTSCKYCGEKVTIQPTVTQAPAVQQAAVPAAPTTVVIQQATPQQVFVTGINPAWPVKNKLVAALLAIFLGSLGIHKFYLGKTGMGVAYLLFCWTCIPGFIGFIEGILYLVSNDENFQLKHHVRLQ